MTIGTIRKTILAMMACGGILLVSCAAPTAQTTAHTDIQSPAVAGTKIGNLAPDFALSDLSGQTVRLSSLQGRPVLLNFWATWCPYCKEEMPYLQQVYDAQSGNGLEVLEVDIEESPAKVSGYLSSDNLSLPVVLDTSGSVSQQYGVQYLPTTFLIDSSGVVRYSQVGAFPNKQALDNALKSVMP